MKRNSKIAVVLATATALTGAIVAPAFAHDGNQSGWSQQDRPGAAGGHGNQRGGMGGQMGGGQMGGGMGGGMGGSQKMMQEMMRMHGQMGAMGGQMDGQMGGGFALFGEADTNGDGRVTPQEARDAQLAALKKYDANGDGTLSLDEFEALHSAAIRERMVDRFQALDNDGDGKITTDEVTAKADRMEKMQAMQKARTDDHDKPGDAPATGSGGMMNGQMNGAGSTPPKN